MKPTATHPSHKRPFNRHARKYTDNLSATVDSILADYVAKQGEAVLARQQLGDAVAEAWNRFHAAHASFADDYSTL